MLRYAAVGTAGRSCAGEHSGRDPDSPEPERASHARDYALEGA
jgi:hypothetical protein